MNIYAMKKPKRINAVSISFVIVGALVGYTLWAVIPIYWPVFQLTGIMRGICSEAYRVPQDDKLMARLLKDGRRTGLKLSEDNFRLTRIQYTEEELFEKAKDNDRMKKLMIQRGKECLLEMRYEDDFPLPLVDKTVHWAFEKEVRSTLEQVKWEKACTCVTPGPQSSD